MKAILLFPFTLLAMILGDLSWTAPTWLTSIIALIKRKPSVFIAGFVLLLIIGGVYQYIQTLAQPIVVAAKISKPSLTGTSKHAKADSLNIKFVYDFSNLKPDQERPSGKASVARIDLIDQKLASGVSLSPAKKGTWLWMSDNRLQFTPETDWPAGTEYTVSFDDTIFNPQTILASQSSTFKTHSFDIKVADIEFYQDPKDVSIRRVISTVKFSHPVDKKSFEKHVNMTMRPSGATKEVDPVAYEFDITYHINQREAYLSSKPLSLPKQTNYMTVLIDDDVKTLLGGETSQAETQRKVLIPDIYSFLKVEEAETQIVRNENNQPEQVLTLAFTDYLDEKELQSKLTAYALPRNKHWKSTEQLTAAVLAKSEKVSLKMIPNERSNSKLFNFTFDAPEEYQLYVKIDKGFKSINDFVHASFYDKFLYTPAYPKEVTFSGEGSVLTYSGNHKLSVVTRGVPRVKFTIGKLLEKQIYHLVSQTNGDISDPDFINWRFSKENIAEFEEEYVDLNMQHPKEVNYSSLDLSYYLPEEKNRFGLFFVDAQAWDKERDYSLGVSDSRLILVTDLGIIVKNNADSTHDVFVQSIQTGEPVSGATVELLGANGVALFSEVTSERGHVSLPPSYDYGYGTKPTVYIVKTDNDISFIPYDRSSRQINMSRFDIGGVRSNQDAANTLNGFLFSDRGIYRPGEIVTVGLIVKNEDLSNVEDIPLEVVITGPRGNEVKVSRIRLSKNGFNDFHYKTDTTSDTGRYKVSLHIINNGKWRGEEIGSTSVKVEEFQPDTMKIESKLAGTDEKGWRTAESLQANVSLNNLFGIPAQNRKMQGRVIVKPAHFRFSKFANYYFATPYLNKDKKPLYLNEMLKAQQTDADGLASFDINLARFQSGTYQLEFIAEGFDQAGGRSVVAINHALISPLSTLLGYKADGDLAYINADSERSISFIAINQNLEQVAVKGLTLKKIEIQTTSTLVKQRNGTYKYQTIQKEDLLSEDDLTINKSALNYALDTVTPGDFVIEIYDEQSRRLARIPYSVVGFGNLAGKIDKNAELQIKLNKTDYRANETIEMSIKAPYSGAGLITIETNKVHTFKWFKTDEESTVQSIVVPEGLDGTAYINVAFVRDVSSSEIFTSPLSYAVQPFSIDKAKRTIDIDLNVADIVRPGKAMEIGFSSSKPASIAIFAIDEGILQVAGYNTPDPLSHFLKKRALDVETLQILDLILPDFELLKSLSASGGGSGKKKDLAKNLNPFARKLDKPAVFWSGIVEASSQQQTVSFDVPDTFAGSLTVMAIAVGEESMGYAAESTIARGPFVISPNVLTQAAPGDEFLVTVGVANIIANSGLGADVTVAIKPSTNLEIIGDSKTQLKIDEGSEGKAQFKVRAKQQLGAADLIFTASHKNEEFSRTASLSVRPAMPYYASFDIGFSDKTSTPLLPNRSLYDNLAEQTVSASASPLVVVDGLTAYLDAYPHGCTEQVVSKVFPLVGLMSYPAYAPHIKNVNSYFSHAISKLRGRQQSDGGFAFWPGSSRSASYPSIYVMHFLIEARDLGYPVPNDMMERGAAYLDNYVGGSSTSLIQARDRANAIYLLTRLGNVTTNYLVDLEEYLDKSHNKIWQQDILSAYIASSYQLLKKEKEAVDLISDYQLGERKNRYSDDFHSQLAQDAQYIYLLSKHFKRQAESLSGEKILQLTDKIFKGDYNTISAAYSILALGAYSEVLLDNTVDEVIEFIVKNTAGEETNLTAKAIPFLTANYPVATTELAVKSDKPIYYLNVQSGFDNKLPQTAVNEGIEIHRDFLDAEGNPVTSFEQGKELTVRLRVRALEGKSLTNIAIIDLLPGGFEIIRSSVSRTAYNWRADYIDIREDRVVYYGDFDASVRELTYKVKLTAAGTFVVPPSYAESMYDRSISSISKSGSFKVTPSK